MYTFGCKGLNLFEPMHDLGKGDLMKNANNISEDMGKKDSSMISNVLIRENQYT